MQMRRYQQDIIDEAKAALDRSGSVVLQMPTGAGKTKTATEIVRQETGVVWVVVHRRELVRQTAKEFALAGFEFGVVSAGKCAETGKKYPLEPHKRIQIISIGSLSAKRDFLPDPDFVVWDECHHLAAKSWADIRESLTSARHLGLTATPERFDGAGLRNWFAELVCGPPIPKLVPDYLSPYIYFAPSSPDLAAAKLRAGDYRAEDAAKAMSAPVIIGDAIREYKEKAEGKRAIAFCVTTEASRDLVERFNSEGIPAVHVDAKTKDDVRLKAVTDLAAGRIKVLSNVEVFTEGVDIPEVDAAILMRPTKSPTLFLQMVGRVLRKSPGKGRAIIFDHAGLIEDHGKLSDPWEWSIDGGAAMRRRKASTGFRKCPKCKHCPDEREPVCSSCGHEYETGREIGVYDGVLRVVDEGVPEGCESQKSASRRIGVSDPTIRKWIERGAPLVGGFIPIADFDLWVSKNVDQRALAERIERNKRRSMDLVEKPIFAKRMGVYRSAVTRWIANEMPTNGDLIPYSDAKNWVEKNVDFNDPIERQGITNAGDFLTLASFGRLFDVGESTAHGWRERGLPMVGALVPEAAGRLWVMDNVCFQSLVSKNPKKRAILGVDNAGSFSRRIKRNIKIIGTFKKQGMPTSGLLIPTRPALEWVRDNRPDIVIPPEAWPS